MNFENGDLVSERESFFFLACCFFFFQYSEIVVLIYDFLLGILFLCIYIIAFN